jgi:hypothetical protein
LNGDYFHHHHLSAVSFAHVINKLIG